MLQAKFNNKKVVRYFVNCFGEVHEDNRCTEPSIKGFANYVNGFNKVCHARFFFHEAGGARLIKGW